MQNKFIKLRKFFVFKNFSVIKNRFQNVLKIKHLAAIFTEISRNFPPDFVINFYFKNRHFLKFDIFKKIYFEN